MSQATLSTHDLASLRSRMTVATPDDESFETSRLAWNRAHDQKPLAVAVPESADDVVAVVDFARQHGIRVAAQATGHFAGSLAPLDGTILLKTERMRGLSIDRDRRRARIDAGVQWHEVANAAAEHGLAGLAGSAPDIGVVGYTLGGGMGWLARKYGLAANSVLSADVVTADGQRRTADFDREPDLFWALRGGGGSFAVVTGLEFELYPVREVYGGIFFFPVNRAGEVLNLWRGWVENVPDELTSVGRVLHFPPIPEVPEMFRGRSFALVEAVYIGSEAEGAELVAPFRALGPEFDTFAMIEPPALGELHMDPPDPVPAAYGGGMLASFPGDVVDRVVDVVAGTAPTALLSVEIRHLGGALARSSSDHGALDALDGAFAHFSLGLAMTPEMRAAVEDDVKRVQEAFAPADAGRTYFNFSEHGVESHALFPPETLRRLGNVKREYDPEGLIVACHPVAPA